MTGVRLPVGHGLERFALLLAYRNESQGTEYSRSNFVASAKRSATQPFS